MQGGGSNNATTQFVPTPDVAGTRAMPPVAAAGYPQPTGLGGANPYDQYPPEPAYGRQPRQQEPRRSNLGPILVGVAIVVVLALVGFLVTKLLTDGGAGGGTTVSMPSLLKQPEETAKRTLTDLGFKDSSITTTQEKSDTVTKGSVIKQDPQPKASVSTADQVTLTISSGRDTVSVPDLAGDTVADATAALKKAGLSVGDTKTVEETSRAAGRVVKTDPTSDEDVKPGSSVILYVASSQVTVPSDLVNKTYSDAKAELAKFGLKVRQVKTPTTDVDPGTVMSASPGGGSKVSRGSTVTLEVAVAQTDETATTGPTSTPSGQPTDTQPTQNPTTEPGAGGTTDPTNSSDDG
jgi:serine/threonine-protein kinase